MGKPAFAGLFGVLLIALEERAGLDLRERTGVAVLVDESSEGVGLLAVGADRISNDGGRLEAIALPFQAAGDCPVEDAGEFGFEFG